MEDQGNAPFLNGLFLRAFSKRENGPFRHSGKRPITEGKRPINANGQKLQAKNVVFEMKESKRKPGHFC